MRQSSVPMGEPTLIALIGTGGGLVTVALSAFAAWFFGRRQVKVQELASSAQLQEAMNNGFAVLFERYSIRERELTGKIEEQNDLIETQSNQIANLIGWVRGLAQSVQSLESTLRKHGLDVPSRPYKFEDFEGELPGAYRLDRRAKG